MVGINSYKEAEEYILTIPRFTTKNSLEDTKSFYEVLGKPGNKAKIIHVAGTNGKGSVCSYLNAILLEGGYSVGMFTSPHLITMRERFRIFGQMVGEEEFVEAFHLVMNLVEKPYHPTFFELLFFMGMVIFENRKVDYIVLETGLGGRLDATNAIESKEAAVITKIGLDHTKYLGNTVEQIAAEKAGIIKAGTNVIYLDHNERVSEVIRLKARQMNAAANSVDKEILENYKIRNKSIDFSLNSRYYGYVTITLPTLAAYQVENASLAIKTIEVLDKAESITKEQIQHAVSNTVWEGRMEEILPGVYVDGAHNVDGIEAFVHTVRDISYKQSDIKNILLFSVVKDKNYEDMIQKICESNLFSDIVLTRIDGERGTDTEEMKKIFKRHSKTPVHTFESLQSAMEACMLKKTEDYNLYIAGSLYLIGDIKKIIG